MQKILDLMSDMTHYLNKYLWEICMAQIATVLVVYGHEINQFFRKWLKPFPWFPRITIFILINAFGYGVVTIFGSKLLAQLYYATNPYFRYPFAFAIFFLIGVLAERKKHI